MEFFASIAGPVPVEQLQQHLTVAALADLCASVDTVLESDGDTGLIYCLWGEFSVRRELIRNGVRFSLPGCPNALAWTVTSEAEADPPGIVVHCTINRSRHEPDFVESIEEFVDDWREGLVRNLVTDSS